MKIFKKLFETVENPDDAAMLIFVIAMSATLFVGVVGIVAYKFLEMGCG